MNKWLCCLCVLCCGALLAHAADKPHKIWVVAIGVNTYQKGGLNDLSYAADAVRKIADAFSEAWPGVETDICQMTASSPDVRQQPTQANVLEKLANLKRQVQPEDRVIFYFCGHGIEIKDAASGKLRQYLLMYDGICDKDNTETTAHTNIEVSDLRQQLEAIDCRECLLWLDACRNDPHKHGGSETGVPTPRQAFTDMRPHALACTTFYGCSAGEFDNYDEHGRSFFTEALVDGLKGKAADPITGEVTLRSLMKYTTKRVPEDVGNRFGKDSDVKQNPVMLPVSSDDEKIVLVPPKIIALPQLLGDDGADIADSILYYLQNTGTLKFVARTRLDAVLKDKKLSDLLNPDNAQNLGNMVRAGYVLVGSVGAAREGKRNISMQLVEVEYNRVIAVASETIPLTDWTPAVEQLADKLLCQMWKAGICTKLTNSVSVVTNPPGAQVKICYIDMEKGDSSDVVEVKAKTPTKVDGLRPGKANIIATCEGYRDIEKLCTIQPDGTIDCALVLPPIKRNLIIVTTPPEADLTIDGEVRYEKTNDRLVLPDQSPGHTIHIVASCPGFENTEKTLTIEAGAETDITVPIRLNPKPSKIIITSKQRGTAVYFDNDTEPTGVTGEKAIERVKPIGQLKVIGRIKGFKDDIRDVIVRPGKDYTIVLDPIPQAGWLKVTTTPPGAVITIDDKPQGHTPFDTPLEVELKEVEVKAVLDHYYPMVQKITVPTGEEKPLDLVLKPKPGHLMITTTPPGAHVLLDGVDKAVTPLAQPIELSPGVVKISVQKEHYFDQSQLQTIPIDADVLVDMTLQPHTGSLRVTSDPSGAQVFIGDAKEPKGNTPYLINNLPPGNIKLKLTSDGYLPDTLERQVLSDQETLVKDDLQPDPTKGQLKIISDPPNGRVVVRQANGDEKAADLDPASDLLISGLNPGQATVIITNPYSNRPETVTNKDTFLAAGKLNILIVKQIVPRGKLFISSVPPGASVFIDGKQLMDDEKRKIPTLTPDKGELKLYGIAIGPHTIMLRKEQFGDYNDTKRLIEGTNTLNVKLPAKPGTLVIMAEPIGAIVQLDNSPITASPTTDTTGRSVWTLPNIEAGVKHVVRVSLPGYETQQQDEIIIEPARLTPLTLLFKLQRLATIEVTTVPTGADVIVKGVSRGPSPKTVTFEKVEAQPGAETPTVQVLVMLSGYRVEEREVPLKMGESMAINFPLLEEKVHPGDETTNRQDGAAMVWVPSGKMEMGSNSDSVIGKVITSAKPVHTVYVSGCWMYKYEVTVKEYQRFCTETHHNMPTMPDWGWKDDHPVVNVCWQDAADYAKWAGGRLPTEAEWEYAARGGKDAAYPWGNEWNGMLCHNAQQGATRLTAPVQQYSDDISPFRVCDMAGNVAEWCADWYAPEYYVQSPLFNPLNKQPGKKQLHVIRGGAWDTFTDYRATTRYFEAAKTWKPSLGFRIVVDVP